MTKALTTRSGRAIAHDPARIDKGSRAAQIIFQTHYAERFTKDRSEEDKGDRSEQVRRSFNSPFWPFVLVTTSIGQEGLDFHQFCHAICHWNLPSNPVDFEQREGRIYRFKGHAVRKNIAQSYAETGLEGEAEPWAGMFQQAADDRPDHLSELTPYWVFPLENGSHVERHIPALPLSRDVERYARLKKDTTLYRMAFGQPRQDDLLNYFHNRGDDRSNSFSSGDYLVDLHPNPTRPQAKGDMTMPRDDDQQATR